MGQFLRSVESPPRTTSFRSRLTAHTLLGVDIKPTTTSVATAPLIVTAHKDTSVEDEADEAVEVSGGDETSNVEVISLVSSPSLFIGEVASDSIKETDDASKSSAKVQGPDEEEEDSDLIFQLVKMEVDAENQEPPPPRENSQELLYSDNFEEEEEGATMRSDDDRLSTIPEDDGEESRDGIQCCREFLNCNKSHGQSSELILMARDAYWSKCWIIRLT